MTEHMLVKRVSQYVMPHIADQIVSDVEDSLWLALRDQQMRREGAALATAAAVKAVQDIDPTSDRRWEWVPRRAVIDAIQMAGEDAVSVAEETTP